MARDNLEHWSASLRLSRRRRQAIVREIHSHLEEAQDELRRAGWSPEDAARESFTRFGDPAEIATAFEEIYRPSRRKQLALAFALAGSMLVGAYGIGGSLASASPRHSTGTTHAVKHTLAHHRRSAG